MAKTIHKLRIGNRIFYDVSTSAGCAAHQCVDTANVGHVERLGWSFDWNVYDTAGLAISNVSFLGVPILLHACQPFCLTNYLQTGHVLKDGIDPGMNGTTYKQVRPDFPLHGDWAEVPAGDSAVVIEEHASSALAPASVVIWARFYVDNYQFAHQWQFSTTGTIHASVGMGSYLLGFQPFTLMSPATGTASHIHNFYWRIIPWFDGDVGKWPCVFDSFSVNVHGLSKQVSPHFPGDGTPVWTRLRQQARITFTTCGSAEDLATAARSSIVSSPDLSDLTLPAAALPFGPYSTGPAGGPPANITVPSNSPFVDLAYSAGDYTKFRFRGLSPNTGFSEVTERPLDVQEAPDYTSFRLGERFPSYELALPKKVAPDRKYSTADLWLMRRNPLVPLDEQLGQVVMNSDSALSTYFDDVSDLTVIPPPLTLWYCGRHFHTPRWSWEEAQVVPWEFIGFELMPANIYALDPGALYTSLWPKGFVEKCP